MCQHVAVEKDVVQEKCVNQEKAVKVATSLIVKNYLNQNRYKKFEIQRVKRCVRKTKSV